MSRSIYPSLQAATQLAKRTGLEIDYIDISPSRRGNISTISIYGAETYTVTTSKLWVLDDKGEWWQVVNGLLIKDFVIHLRLSE